MSYLKLRDEQHLCDKPGWWRRWRDGVGWGALWQCDDCRAVYRWEGHWALYQTLEAQRDPGHPGEIRTGGWG